MSDQQDSSVCPRCGALMEVRHSTNGMAPAEEPSCDACGYHEGGEILYALPNSPSLPPPKQLLVRWTGKTPTAAEVAAVRQLVPDLAQKPLAVVVRELSNSERFLVGAYHEFELNELVARGRHLGLEMVIE